MSEMIMGIIYGSIYLVFGFLFFMGRRESLKELENKQKWKAPFYRAAAYLIRKNKNHKSYDRNKQVSKNFKTLNPGRKINQEVECYYIHKISIVLMIILIGNVFATGIHLRNRMNVMVADGAQISRNAWGAGSFSVDLQAESEENQKENISITVEERKLTREEADGLVKKMTDILPMLIQGENEGINKVTRNLNLIRKTEKYPFLITWESSNYMLLKPNGTLENEKIKETGETVTLTALITYQDYCWEHELSVCVYPLERSAADEWKNRILEAVEKSDKASVYLKTLTLPEEVEGNKIIWKENKTDDSIYFWLVMIIGAAAFYIGQDKDLHKKIIKRNVTLQREYPEFVGKLTLYLGAGMTVKNAWRRMVQDYQEQIKKEGKRAVIYDEMKVSCHEFDSGVEEGKVYYDFGKRMENGRYQKLSGLLCGNLQKGNNRLLQVLKEESDFAREERKRIARTLGEEAETKLLFPMIIMLSIVMIIIMVPAYFMFSV